MLFYIPKNYVLLILFHGLIMDRWDQIPFFPLSWPDNGHVESNPFSEIILLLASEQCQNEERNRGVTFSLANYLAAWIHGYSYNLTVHPRKGILCAIKVLLHFPWCISLLYIPTRWVFSAKHEKMQLVLMPSSFSSLKKHIFEYPFMVSRLITQFLVSWSFANQTIQEKTIKLAKPKQIKN